jgi:arylsulfatase A-like enzyme
LLEDLSQRGLLDETLVVWMGDFGRTPRITRPWASRDHWPHANSVMLAGGGIRPGVLHGTTDDQAAYVTDAPVSPADLTATMFELLGVPSATATRDAAGRPHRLSTGTPIRGIMT